MLLCVVNVLLLSGSVLATKDETLFVKIKEAEKEALQSKGKWHGYGVESTDKHFRFQVQHM